MPLTKKHLRELHGIRDTLARGLRYIRRADIAVCLKGYPGTTTLHAVRPLDGVTLYEVEKEIGSDLCAVATAFESLTRIIERDEATCTR
jgi:hypothetical protein